MSKKSTKGSTTSASVRMSIEEQTAAFLNSGGIIQQIGRGASGQVSPVSSEKPNVKNG
ncbi:MAG: hypothetical protein ACI9Y1_003269 [Lentisphaeria bacterium]|jgi:hypothetical protein